VVALILILAAYGAKKSFLGLELMPSSTAGLAWLGSGVTLALLALLQFRKVKTTALPTGKPQHLVTGGAYIWTRNPMYLGTLTALIGLAFYTGTLSFWLVPPAFYLIINRIHIPSEEARLTEMFGADYSSYRDRVQRWI
jgi:protein-S-isoprenylcysteine O-methyltransferase Ste14